VRRPLAIAMALLRLGFAESLAYRVELFLWVLSTTMPFVMMALFTAVASDKPMVGFGPSRIVTYFLVALVVRHLTSSWSAWELARDIRQGTLSLKLMHPVHPLLSYAVATITAVPLRAVAILPILVACPFVIEPSTLSHRGLTLALAFVSVVQSLALSIAINLVVGCSSFFFESGVKFMDFVLVAFFLASGYLIPLEFFPAHVRAFFDLLPFRYQLALPVELLTGVYDERLALAATMCLRQTAYVAAFFLMLGVVWRRGVGRFEAFGG
jgi:ABC-2 type transport system permease protein